MFFVSLELVLAQTENSKMYKTADASKIGGAHFNNILSS